MEFDGFIDTSKIASFDLQKFNSHVGHAVDKVLSTTRWTTRQLQDIESKAASQGAIGRAFDNLMLPFLPVTAQTGDKVLDQYVAHTQEVQMEITKLVSEAQALLLVLQNLEDRLDVINGIAGRDNEAIRAAKSEVLQSIWAMVGGHRGTISKMDAKMALLNNVEGYRKMAYDHVAQTILKLMEMSANLDDLRDRVMAPELSRETSVVPLSVHIENINRGVARLEAGREGSRKAELA